MKYTLLLITFIISGFFITGCGGGSPDSGGDDQETNTYTLHTNITTTIFWVGEEASSANGDIPNLASAWDDIWMLHYGGVDTPEERSGYYPTAFTPMENPFYFALPFNDFDENGNQKADLESYIPWAKASNPSSQSICKNRWIKITKNDTVVYAQWEDVGPFNEDDKAYVFGTATPSNEINAHAGLDVSPAVRDYLHLNDIDSVNWEFIDEDDVPEGPWKEIITNRNIVWLSEWYTPDLDVTWQWQLQGEVNTAYSVTLYDIDLFDSNQSLINSLKNDTRKVICYFSAGSYEEWREDADDFPSEALGNNLDNWEGEKWLDIRNPLLRDIIKARLDLAEEKGCDGVEPDNVDGYTNNTGFSLSAEDQLDYNIFLADEAHKRGLSIALKNDLDQVEELEPFFDFAVNEQCHEYNECDLLQPFIEHSKPVLNAEYDDPYVNNTNGARDTLCSVSESENFRTLVLPLLLDDSFRFSCND